MAGELLDPNRPLTPQEQAQWQALALQSGRGPVAAPAAAPAPIPVAAPAAPVPVAPAGPQSTDPNGPNYVNPLSPYYVNPNAHGATQLGNSTPKPAPAAPADPNRYAQQSTDPTAPYYVNPQSPYFNPKAPKPAGVGAGGGPIITPEEQARVTAENVKAPGAAPIGPPASIKFATPGGPGSLGGGGEGQPRDINWGGGGGGTATIPQHEIALVAPARQKALGAAIDHETAALEDQQKAVKGSAQAAGEVEHQKAIGEQNLAKVSEDLGVDTRLRAQAAADESATYRKHIDEFSKKVGEEQIDPRKMYHDASTAQAVTWTIASFMSALGSGLTHTPDKVAGMLEGMVAQDIAAQRANHEIHAGRVNDMNQAYAQAMHATGNKEEAERVATGYALEAAKHEANALIANSQSDVQKQRGEELVAQIEERQALVGEKKEERGIGMNHLVQAQTVGGGPGIKELGKLANEYIDKQASLGHVVTPDEGFRYATKILTGRDPLPGAGGFSQGAKSEPGGKQETQVATDEFNRQIDDLRKHPVITGSGLGTALGAHLPQRLAPDSNDAQQQLHDINTRNLQAIGKVAKDADGKPNKTMIEKIEQKFEIHLSDSPEIKQQKLQGIANVYNALAREQGANAPKPSGGGAPPGFKP